MSSRCPYGAFEKANNKVAVTFKNSALTYNSPSSPVKASLVLTFTIGSQPLAGQDDNSQTQRHVSIHAHLG